MGSVEGDEVAAAADDAAEAHNVAVEGQDAAEALADETAPEAASNDAEPADVSAQADPAEEGTDAAEALAGGDTETVESSDEPAADASDEAAAVDDDAPVSDTAAFEGADAAEAHRRLGASRANVTSVHAVSRIPHSDNHPRRGRSAGPAVYPSAQEPLTVIHRREIRAGRCRPLSLQSNVCSIPVIRPR